MTQWEKIHKSGKSWGSISEGIHSLFKQFLKKSEFEIKHVLDIGCGTGNILNFYKIRDLKQMGLTQARQQLQKLKNY